MRRIPFMNLTDDNAPYMDRMVQAAERVIRSGRYIGGAENDALEAKLAAILRAPHVVGVSNGLDALRLILKAYVELGVLAPGDEVLYPANTYIASVLAISDAGLVPVPVDIDECTLNIDAALIPRAITPRTRAIMVVHLYGRVAWSPRLVEICRDNNLKIIEDCAQALGARSVTTGLHGSPMAGALGDAAGISFYPTKNVGAVGDAGAVVTHDKALADTVRALANYGSDRRYHNIYRGLNCRLDPIQAAMLCVKLDNLEQENADRFARALVYDRTIANPAVVKPLVGRDIVDCVWHQYPVRVPAARRAAFIQALADKGIGTDIHYPVPPHRQPCYAGMAADVPVTDRVAGELVSLPISRCVTLEDAAYISTVINDISL